MSSYVCAYDVCAVVVYLSVELLCCVADVLFSAFGTGYEVDDICRFACLIL